MVQRRLWWSLLGIIVLPAVALVGNLIAGNTPQLGLDLQGGASVTLRPVGDYEPAALDQIPDIYRARIDSLGVAEPEILRQGDTIVVNLPGVRDQERALDLIGVTGKVVFRPVIQRVDLATPIDLSTTTTAAGATTTTAASTTTAAVTTTAAGPTTTAGATTTAADSGTPTETSAQGFLRPGQQVGTTTTAPATTIAPTTTSGAPTTSSGAPTTTAAPIDPASLLTPDDQDIPEQPVTLSDRSGRTIYSLGPAFARGELAIDTAQARVDQQLGGWYVQLTLTGGADGLGAWNQAAGQCYNRAATCADGGMAIVLDHRVISAPVPQIPFFSNTDVSITGDFREREARDLARVLQYGATPVEMRPEAVQTVSPTLGKDSLRAAIVAGIIGVALVLAFLLLYYRSLALVVVVGITISAAILWSVIAWLSRVSGLALTLAGVTGVIVSVGVTIDSYVVYFERLKDEVIGGRTLKGSAQRGFMSAWRTILAADIVSLLGAGVLWWLSVGSVRGFAFFLGLSTLCDIVVAWFFTRPAVLLLVRSGRLQRGTRVLGVETAPSGGAA